MGVRLRSIRVGVAFVLLGALLAPAGAGAQQVDPRAVGSDPSDASLASLSLTGAELSFDAAETQYWVAYGVATPHPTIEAAAAQAGAQIAFSPADADPDTAGYQVATSGLQVVRVNVTSPDGTARRSYVLWLFDYRLRSLGIEGHDIGYDRRVADYAITVPDEVDTVTVTADTGDHTLVYGIPDADPNTDGHQVDLEIGANEITVTATPKPTRVIATPQTYTIAVTRAAVPLLSSLTLSGASLSFAAATTSYDVDFVTAADHTTVRAAAAQPGASVDISPADADATAPGHQVAITAGAATAVTVTVTAEDMTATQTYRLNVSDARLRGLAVTGYDIGFDPATTAHRLRVPHSVETVTVGTGTESNSKLDIAYSPADADPNTDGHQVDLDVGANTVTVTATLKGGTDSQSYTVTITRAVAPNADATLSSLTLTGAAIDFDPSTTSYAVMYVTAADYATLAATASHPDATVSIDVDDDADTAGNQVRIVTDHTVNVTVTAADDTTTKTYKVSVWNVRLQGLRVVGYDIGFDPATAAYTLDVPHSVDTVTVGALGGSNSKLNIVYSPADADTATRRHQIDLSEGTNTVTATATLMGGTDSQTYTITVTRAAATTDASLSALTLTGSDFDFDFDPNTHAYRVIFPEEGHTTVGATAAQTGASVNITPDDADPDTPGHQVQVDGTTTTVTVTVTAPDTTTKRVYRVDVRYIPPYSRNPSLDLTNLQHFGVPSDVWTDGETWYVNYWSFPGGRTKVYAYDVETGARAPEFDIGKPYKINDRLNPEAYVFPWGIWSDGEVMYVADEHRQTIYKYSLVEETYNDFLGTFGVSRTTGDSKRGLWSDGETLWLAERLRLEIRAFDLATGQRTSSKDFPTLTLSASGNHRPTGIWSDGAVMWVADESDGKIYAYDLHTKVRLRFFEFDNLRLGRSEVANGLWSDGRTMWVAIHKDNQRISDKIYAYTMPRASELKDYAASDVATIFLSGIHLDYHPSVRDFSVVADVNLTSTTVDVALRNPDAEVVITPADADPDTDGHQIDLSGGTPAVSVKVTADGITTTYAIDITRDGSPADEFLLSGLAIDGAEISFDKDTANYRASVAADVDSVTVTPTAYDSAATVTVLPADADSNTDGHQVSLTAGVANIITVTVTAADDSRMFTYTIAVTRPTS